MAFLSDSVDRSDRFLRSLSDAGTPDVKDGSAIARTIADGFGELRSTFVDAERDARRVSTGDPASFNERVTAINDAIRIGSDRSRETITRARVRYETRELDRAFNQASACKRIV